VFSYAQDNFKIELFFILWQFFSAFGLDFGKITAFC